MNSIRASDGERLAAYAWEPGESPRGLVFLMHGYAEHAGRYAALAAALNAAGLSVHALDHRGHGHSGGRRGFVRGPAAIAEDFVPFMTGVMADRPGLPAALFGHSMGGAAAVRVALSRQDRLFGLVLSSPFIEPVPKANPVSRAAVALLAGIAPRLPVQRLDTRGLSREASEVAAYEQDPLVHHGPVVAATASALIRSGDDAVRSAPGLTLPLLMFHGAIDPIAGIGGTRRLFEAVGSRDRQLRVMEGAPHEILNDLDRDTMTGELRDWLADRLPGRQDG